MYTFLKDFEVFDIETVVEGEGALRPLAISYSENEKICYKYLTDKDDLLEVITSTFKNGIIYYAHNLLFDFSFIIPYIVKNSIEYN